MKRSTPTPNSTPKAVLQLGPALFFIAMMSFAPAYGQIYTEGFTDYEASDWDNGYCEVRWCPTPEVVSSVSCDTPNVLYEYGSTDDDIIWVYFGTQGCTQAEIVFNYGQWEYEPYLANLADTKLKYKTSTGDSFSCSSSGFSVGANLNRTYSTPPGCFPANHIVNLDPSHRAVYWMFDKGTHPAFFFADDIEIYLVGCECGPGDCVTELDEDFGTYFQSGTVCQIFPDTFEQCAGNGPYVSTGTACGSTGDCCMTFGTGYPYSEAILRCVDLSGVAEACLHFNYTKASGTLGPYVYASTDGDDWSLVWSAPFYFDGGCVPGCVDLGDYTGQSVVWLKFSSGTSSASQAHGIDDILLVLGQGCPSCEDPTADAGTDEELCPGMTVVLEGSASGGSGGLCPGDYSPSWDGPGIVSGGDTFNPTVDATGIYTLTVWCDTCWDEDTVEVTGMVVTLGDANGDGAVNGLDVEAFIDVLFGDDTDPAHICAANTDGLNGVTVDDIPSFIALLLDPP